MTVALIDTGALLKVLSSSLLAGVGVAVIFSVVIVGATRTSEMRRAHRTAAATGYAALAAVGLLLISAIVIYGLVLVVRKH